MMTWTSAAAAQMLLKRCRSLSVDHTTLEPKGSLAADAATQSQQDKNSDGASMAWHAASRDALHEPSCAIRHCCCASMCPRRVSADHLITVRVADVLLLQEADHNPELESSANAVAASLLKHDHARLQQVETEYQLEGCAQDMCYDDVQVACTDTNFKQNPQRTQPQPELLRDMAQAQFCLVMPGNGQSSGHLADAFFAGCIPVFLGPPFHTLPFPHLVRQH